MSERFLVILTALDLEYQAIREKLTKLRKHSHREGTRFEIGQLADGHCQVALGLTGKGNQAAAVLSERAIAEFDPLAVLFVGVAGALWPHIGLGDVVVATHIYAYHGGTSEDDGFKARPRVWETSHAVDQLARHTARTSNWTQSLPERAATPKIHFGPIAAGEVVQDSAISDEARWLRNVYNDALAIEMESAGVAQAGHLNRSRPVIVVRGISDRADGTKTGTDQVNWQPRAVANAAAFATTLAEELAVELKDNRSTATENPRGADMAGTFQNIASGNAHVGFQAGHVYGNISTGQPLSQAPQDVALHIAQLRELLEKAKLDRELDEATAVAAEGELVAVTESLPASTEQAKNKALLALKKLRGLVMDVAGLAASVTAIIHVVRGM